MQLNEIISNIETRIRNSSVILPQLSDHHKTYFDRVIPLIKNDGLWLELGVYRGRSIQTISKNGKTTFK